MSLLLDTHVILWWIKGDPTLPDELRDRLNHDPDIYVSPASIWEVAIKRAIGKLDGPADLPERIRDSAFVSLAIEPNHAIAAGRLPMHHRDPFDRILVAQARCEELTLATRDPLCQKYDVSILPV